MGLRKTKGKCPVCKGDIVEKVVQENGADPFSRIIGPGSADQIVTVSKGFHCKKCGLKYAFVPK